MRASRDFRGGLMRAGTGRAGGPSRPPLRRRVHETKHLRHIDFQGEVGRAAGEVYRLLESGGECDLRILRGKSFHKGALFGNALGWLLREGKIEVGLSGGAIVARLKPQ